MGFHWCSVCLWRRTETQNSTCSNSPTQSASLPAQFTRLIKNLLYRLFPVFSGMWSSQNSRKLYPFLSQINPICAPFLFWSNLIWTPIYTLVFQVVLMAFLASDALYRTLHNTSNDVHAFYIPLSVHLLPGAHHEATNCALSPNILPLPPPLRPNTTPPVPVLIQPQLDSRFCKWNKNFNLQTKGQTKVQFSVLHILRFCEHERLWTVTLQACAMFDCLTQRGDYTYSVICNAANRFFIHNTYCCYLSR